MNLFLRMSLARIVRAPEGVKKLQFFMDERCFWTILFCEGKGLQLFYGVALTTEP